MNEDLQPDFDQEKYERFIRSQVNKVLSSFEERVYLIMRRYPAYDLNAAMELDTADAISMAKSALISEYQSSMMLMSVIASSMNRESYKKMRSSIESAIKRLG